MSDTRYPRRRRSSSSSSSSVISIRSDHSNGRRRSPAKRGQSGSRSRRSRSRERRLGRRSREREGHDERRREDRRGRSSSNRRRSSSYNRRGDRSRSRSRGGGMERYQFPFGPPMQQPQPLQIFGNPCMSRDPRLTECRLYIGGMSITDLATSQEVEEIFSKHGKVLGVHLLKGFGFVQMSTLEDAIKAVEAEKGRILRGNKIDVKIADDKFKNGEERWPPPFDGGMPSRFPPPRGMPPPHFMRGGGPPFVPFPSPQMFERGEFPPPWQMPYPPPPGDPAFRFGGGYDRMMNLPPPPRRSRTPSRERRSSVGSRSPRRRGSRSPSSRTHHHATSPPDCLIILLNEHLRSYAKAISKHLSAAGLVVDQQVLDDRVGPDVLEVLDRSTQRGLPLAIVISDQNEKHRSMTVNILFGQPQEHRNMPMMDAIDLAISSYNEHKKDRYRNALPAKPEEPSFLTPTRSMLYLLNLLADSRYLTVRELDDVIRYLQERRELHVEEQGGGAVKRTKANDESDKMKQEEQLIQNVLELLRREQALPVTQQPVSGAQSTPLFPILPPGSSSQPPPSAGAVTDTSAAGMLSAFMAATSQSVRPPPQIETVEPLNTPTINLNNPSIQRALDHLLSSGGSSLFQSLAAPQSTPGGGSVEGLALQGTPAKSFESRLNFVGSVGRAPQYDDWRQVGNELQQ